MNDIRGITDAQTETMIDIMELLEEFPVSEDDVDTTQPAVDEMLMRLCNDDVQMCFQVLRGDLGEVLAESGIMNISLASKIAGLARAVRNVAFDPKHFHLLTQNTHRVLLLILRSPQIQMKPGPFNLWDTRYFPQDHSRKPIACGRVECARNIQYFTLDLSLSTNSSF